MQKKNYIRLFVRGLLRIVFPTKNNFVDFSKIEPEELFNTLPKSKSLSGATALRDMSTGMSANTSTDLAPKITPNVVACLSYKNPTTRALIWNIKFKRDRYALTCGGYIVYKSIVTLLGGRTEDMRANVCAGRHQGTYRAIIIPMPISPTRRRERGYNQCESLAKEVSRYDREKSFVIRTDILVRIKHVEKQTFKNRHERMESLRGVFVVRAKRDDIEKVGDVTLIVLDDVITTGNTLREAMDTLTRAGFGDVRGVGLAH